MPRCIYVEKKCVYLDLVYNRLLGWEGGSFLCCVWEIVFTQDLAVPPNKVFLIGYYNLKIKSIAFYNAQHRKWVQVSVGGTSRSIPQIKKKARFLHHALSYFNGSQQSVTRGFS